VLHAAGVPEAFMELRLDPASAVPIYAQIVEQVRSLVASRALRPGDQLPSVRDLAASIRVNRNTAAKAYQLLEAEGVIETRQGHGCFIANAVTRWSREERGRRVEQSLDRALVEAYHLEIPFEELPAILERRVRNFFRRQQTPARKS
jgi:GntR family transcriptional regulator